MFKLRQQHGLQLMILWTENQTYVPEQEKASEEALYFYLKTLLTAPESIGYFSITKSFIVSITFCACSSLRPTSDFNLSTSSVTCPCALSLFNPNMFSD